MTKFPIAALGLRGAHFNNADALREHRSDAQAYENVVAAFAANPDEAGAIDLHEALDRLGCDGAEIAWHIAQPGQRMERGYLTI
jgi:hypothetical protein